MVQFVLGTVSSLAFLSSWSCIWKENVTLNPLSFCLAPNAEQDEQFFRNCYNDPQKFLFGSSSSLARNNSASPNKEQKLKEIEEYYCQGAVIKYSKEEEYGEGEYFSSLYVVNLLKTEENQVDEVISIQYIMDSSTQLGRASSLVIGLNLSSDSLWLSNHPLNLTDRSPSSPIPLEGRFYIAPSIDYLFSKSLFVPHVKQTSDEVNSPSCEDLRSFKNDRTNQKQDKSPNHFHRSIRFHLITDYFNRFSPDLLPYWFHYCGVEDLPVLYLREILLKRLPPSSTTVAALNDSSTLYNENYLYDIESTCIVTDLDNFQSKHRSLQKQHFYSKYFPLYCVEHFFQILLHDELYREEDHSLDTTEKVVFEFPVWLHSKQLWKNKIQLFHEWLAILRAMENFVAFPSNTLIDTAVNVKVKRFFLYFRSFGLSNLQRINQSNNSRIKTESPLQRQDMSSPQSRLQTALQWNESVSKLSNPAITVLSTGDVYVMIFVMHYHFFEAQSLIEEWRKDCVSLLCHLIVKYHVVSIYDSAQDEAIYKPYLRLKECLLQSSRNLHHRQDHLNVDEAENDCSRLEEHAATIISRYHSAVPSVRASYLELKRFITEIYSQHHIVVVLSGLSALHSFITPCESPLPHPQMKYSQYCQLPEANFFPPVKYGASEDTDQGAANYCLSSEIMVGDSSNPFEESGESLTIEREKERNLPQVCRERGYDPRTIIGVTRRLKIFLFDYLAQMFDLTERTDEEFLSLLCSAMHDWEELNALALSVDWNHRIFDPLYSEERVAELIEQEHQTILEDEGQSSVNLIQQLLTLDTLLPDLTYFHSTESSSLLLPSSSWQEDPLLPIFTIDFASFLNTITIKVEDLELEGWENLFDEFFEILPIYRRSISAAYVPMQLIKSKCMFHNDLVQKFEPLVISLLFKVKFFSLAVLLLKFAELFQACLQSTPFSFSAEREYFATYLEAVYYKIILLSKNARHGVYAISQIEYYLSSKLLHFYRERMIWDLHEQLQGLSPFQRWEMIEKDRTTFKSLPTSSFATMTSSSVELMINSFELVLQICEVSFLLENNLLLSNKHEFFQSLHSYLLSHNPNTFSADSQAVPPPLSYRNIQAGIDYWAKEKQRILQQYQYRSRQFPQNQHLKAHDDKGIEKQPFRMEVITYASNMTEGLESLLLSSMISGVKLKVLGLDAPYIDYATKINFYYNYLVLEQDSDGKRRTTQTDDDDVVLLIDAYDVLLLPQIQKIDQVLYQSKTPIIFCAEGGIYVEYAGGHSYYPRGRYNTNHIKNIKSYRPHGKQTPSSISDDDLNDANDYETLSNPQYFLNSGCILGRRKEMKQLLSFSHRVANIIRDDQQIMLRYMFLSPSTISLDVFHDYSITTYQQNPEGTQLIHSCNFELFYVPHLYQTYHSSLLTKKPKEAYRIGLVHSNNKLSNGIYQHLDAMIKYYYQWYFDPTQQRSPPAISSLTIKEQKAITGKLLQIVWLINNEQLDLAEERLIAIDPKVRTLQGYLRDRENLRQSKLPSFPQTTVDTLYEVIAFGISIG